MLAVYHEAFASLAMLALNRHDDANFRALALWYGVSVDEVAKLADVASEVGGSLYGAVFHIRCDGMTLQKLAVTRQAILDAESAVREGIKGAEFGARLDKLLGLDQ